MIDRLRAALKRAIDKMRTLDLGKLRDRIREAKAQRARKRKARRAFQDERDDLREKLEEWLDEGGHPANKLRELEAAITKADERAEQLHTVMSRRTQLLRRLKPKNLKRTKRRHELASRIAERRRKLRAAIQAHQDETGPGTVTFDGKAVAKWIAAHLQAARSSGVWNGYLISGFRTPEYSESLCYAMCGAPTCPGMCGGRNSNHACPPTATCQEFEGAVDLSDSAGFQRYCRAHGNPLHGNGEMLPGDTPHFSASGR
jgi:hypothetical protein